MLQTLEEFWITCWPALLATAAEAYLLGSLNFAIIVTRLLEKTDIRTYGSGNAGATNVLRSQGKLPALLTTIGDLLKGCAAVLLGGLLVQLAVGSLPAEQSLSAEQGTLYVLFGRYLAGLFCIVGHIFPIYFGFRGGKGILTAFGMLLILDWRVALICLGVFVLAVLCSRMVSLGSCCAAAVLPIVTCLFYLTLYRHIDRTAACFCTIMTLLIAVIVIVKHGTNIRRIAAGTENRLSFGAKKD
ncbi:MAG: glycerol-3-phosphate 1-O-acyltransferase PlsY [Clostridiales bacterium]|nr:glycerol-3-phosphate 1-O-acyltransferase PlsY [Clostridiales bacterium]